PAQSNSPRRIPPQPALAHLEGSQVIISRFVMETKYRGKEDPFAKPGLLPGEAKPGLFLGEQKPIVTFSMRTDKKTFPLARVRAYSTRGQPIAWESVRAKLKKDRLVLITMDGKKADPFYLQNFADGTIVL